MARLLYGLFAACCWLGAQSIQITSLSPEGPLYPGDNPFAFTATVSVTGDTTNAYGFMLIREVSREGNRDIIGISTLLRNSGFQVRNESYGVPPVSCLPNCSASFRNLRPTLRYVLRLEVYAILQSRFGGPEVTRSAPRIIPIVTPAEVAGLSPNQQPLFSDRRLRINVSNASLTQARSATVAFYPAGEFSGSVAHIFAIPTDLVPCRSGSAGQVWGGCSATIVNNSTLELNWRTFLFTRPEERLGVYDLLVSWTEPRTPGSTSTRTRHAVLLDAFRITAAADDDLLILDGVRMTVTPSTGDRQTYTFSPRQENALFAEAGRPVEAALLLRARVSRATTATVWLIARDKSRGVALDQRSMAVSNTFGEAPDLLGTALRFSLPAAGNEIEFTVSMTPADARSPTERVFGGPQAMVVTVSRPPDLTVTRLEVVQTVQTADNKVPLVADKSAIVRMYFGLGDERLQALPNVTARLRGRRGGQELAGSPLAPFNGRITAFINPNRYEPNESLNFQIPVTWTETGELTLVAEVNPQRAIPELRFDNNTTTVTVQFEERRDLLVGYLEVCQALPGEPQRCPSRRVGDLDFLMNQLYPVRDYGILYYSLGRRNWPHAVRTSEDQDRLIASLNQFYEEMDDPPDQLAAWLSVDSGFRLLGRSDPGFAGGVGVVSINKDTTAKDFLDTAVTMAHEVGHNLGLRHPNTADGCGARDANTDWPDRETTRILEPGFHPPTLEFKNPNLHDLMSYCGPATNFWIAPFHYRQLFDSVILEPAQEAAPSQGTASEYLLVTGSARADGTGGEITRTYRVPSPAPVPIPRTTGNHCLVFSSGTGTLAESCFDLSFVDPESDEPMSERAFTRKVPLPPGTTRIALRRGAQELAALAVSPRPPTVRITSPQAGAVWDGGQRSITWSGSDPDGQSLTYLVQYSYDGGRTWTPLNFETSDVSLLVDTADMVGGSDVRFRVLASDGFHTATDTVGPVRVIQRPAIALTPDRVNFGTVAVNAGEVEGTITLRNTGSGPLTITSLATTGAGFRVAGPATPFPIATAAERTVRVRFAASQTRPESGVLVIESNDPARPRVEAPLGANSGLPPRSRQ